MRPQSELAASLPIQVVECATGRSCARARDTLTVDVPMNLPPDRVVEVSDGFRGSYLAASGSTVQFHARTSPLSWRSPGELCLIARSGGVRASRQYRLCSVSHG